MTYAASVRFTLTYLRHLWVVSTLAVFTAVLALSPARAHEVRPAIADFNLSASEITLEIRVMIEAILAGIDLSEVANTDEAEEVETYTDLRALPPQELQARVEAAWPGLRERIIIRAGTATIIPDLVAVTVPEVDDLQLARDTVLALRADLPRDGSTVELGWDAAFGPLVMRQSGPIDTAYTGYLDSGDVTPPLPRDGFIEQSFVTVVTDYIVLGFEHILPKGLDHILFVLGLFFFSLSMRPLLIQISMFTLAHTVTLAFGALGVITISPAIVEPLIAASIVFVAVENILTTKMQPWRPFVIFGFGLLHGIGFASMLNEIGLSQSHLITSLIAFNVGVELGQLTVIALAFFVLGLPFGKKPWWRSRVQIPASIMISLVALWWVLERTVLA